ncbi:MAG: glycosyltransferase family 39 protein [bacterium]
MSTERSRFPTRPEWLLILLFAFSKMLIHFFTYDNFELHRDAYLYYAQSEHLAWGYVAVPPTLAILGKTATSIFGNTLFGLRFFPALFGALDVIIIGLAVKEVGGRKISLLLASLAFILSPAYLHVNALFQPVSINHFYWLLSAYLILVMVNRSNPKMWIWIGLVFGLAFLNKYSIVFFAAAFAFALLLSNQRRLYFSKYFVLALITGLVIILPNVLWQYHHNWPVLMHMAELRRTQLVHVKYSGFLFDQILMNAHALFLWSGALMVLLFYRKEKQYMLFGVTYLLILLLLMTGSGKSYYTLGIYPILFVFGACFTEKYIKRFLLPVTIFLILSMFAGLYFSLSFDGIPITTFEKALNKGAFRWEDGKYYDLPQDMADMTGWKEIGETVAGIYSGLDREDRANCAVFCDHYGQAGAVMFHGKKTGIPQPISFNGSFVFWSPDRIETDYVIYVMEPENLEDQDLIARWFETVELKHVVDNPWFRENGTRIYLCYKPSEETKLRYKTEMAEAKNSYRQVQSTSID